MANTVSVTEFSVALTGFSVTLTVAELCVFGPSPRCFASIFAASRFHVVGPEIHVVGRVCNGGRWRPGEQEVPTDDATTGAKVGRR